MRKGSNPPLYLLSDHLGSTVSVVDANGGNARESFYYSFGSSRQSTANGTTDRLFTGARLENSLGIYQVGGRWYDPTIARFLQPDPMGQLKLNDSAPFFPLTVSYSDPGLAVGLGQWNRSQRNNAAPLDPQLLNRYSYSRNNPETYYDPSGNYVIVGALLGGIVGFGGYYLTHKDDFQWNEAAQWAVGGAALGSGIGAVAGIAGGSALVAGGTGLAVGTTVLSRAAQAPQAQRLLQRFGPVGPARSFASFGEMKREIGNAGDGHAWHHIVEQTAGNIAKFGSWTIQNTQNLVRLPSGAGSIHTRVSGFYSSIRADITGSDTLTIREWLATKSFEFQYHFGIQTIEKFLGEAPVE